jgi:hypothetical protein
VSGAAGGGGAPARRERRRLLAIAGAFVATVALASWATVAGVGAGALRMGAKRHPQRRLVAAALRDATGPPAPDVVWLGDSTIMPEFNASYPKAIGRAHGLRTVVLAAPAMDFWAFYCVMGAALALRPRLVVMIANLRLLDPAGVGATFNDLASFVPVGELPRLLALPYAFRGMTAPRLLLAHALDVGVGEDAFLLVEGIGPLVEEARWWRLLGAETTTDPRTARRRAYLDYWRRTVRAYDTAVDAANPLVRFAAAATDMAVRHGARVAVVVTPVPIVLLTRRGLYERARYAARVDVLRGAIEGAGGVVVDLHEAVGPAGFRDPAGHFTPQGAIRMSRLAWPALAAAADQPAR